MAMIMDMRGHYGDAVKLYEKIIQCSDKPGFVSAAKKNMGQIFFAMGNFNYKKEDYAAALFYYAKATTADPNFAEAWNNKGVAHLKLNQYQEAIESLDKAIKLNCDEALSNKDIAIRLKEISEGIYSSTIVPMP
ncbi:hypothetical protein A2246_02840 [candidate division WOR-1 bacterium RIFOXYA2_FULL_37_7]|nr:MAG: hypothetical protein A2246_02840 [candidate division WOR-1 bacterium RIFOXYA2_FULL_37_7]